MNDLDERLAAATARIGHQYIQLPIQGQLPTYRERVYCYELYHQLRRDWPDHGPFYLNGEVDKAGHHLLRQVEADRCKPDFLVHIPGDMSGNFAVIEVKPCTAPNRGILKDLRTLALFTNSVGYQRALYLIYGATADQAAARARRLLGKIPDATAIEIWTHVEAHRPATKGPM